LPPLSAFARCIVKYTLRAVLTVGILAGFYVVGLAVVVALGYAAYLLTVAGRLPVQTRR
jgi:hypothetical protein